MFEIPDDDDDLFSEDNLKDILQEADRRIEAQKGCEVSSSNILDVASRSSSLRSFNRPLSDLECSSGSPQSKRPRVFADVNHQKRDEVVSKDCQTRENETADSKADPSFLRDAHTLAQHPTCILEVKDTAADPDATPVLRRRSLRKFPGPAGILPPVRSSELSLSATKSFGESPEGQVGDGKHAAHAQEEVVSSQVSSEPFGGAAWQAVLTDLEPAADDIMKKFSVQAMLHKASRRLLPKGKVPLLIGILDSIDFQALDASVVVRDRTGQMQGTLHREVVKDFPVDLQVGAAVVLRQVSVISPSPRTHYLNITGGNIVAIYPSSGHRPTSLALTSSPPEAEHHLTAASATRPCRELMSQYVQAAELELLEAANAAKESALMRLRNKQSPALPAPPSPSLHGPGQRQAGPGLFAGYCTPRLKASAAALGSPNRFTPPRSVPQTPGERTFTFKGNATPAAPQVRMASGNATHGVSQVRMASEMRTPHPATRQPYPGAKNQIINTPNLMKNLVQNVTDSARFSQFQGASSPDTNIRTLNPRALTSQTFHLPNLISHTNSQSQSQALNTSIQPSASTSRTGYVGQQNSQHFSAVSVGVNRNLTATAHTHNPGIVNSITLTRLQMGNTNSVTNSNTSTAVIDSSCVLNQSRNSSSEQSRWSFKPRAMAGQAPAGSGADTTTASHASSKPADPVVSHSGGGGQASVTGSMWDEELSDDILSQLSDDF